MRAYHPDPVVRGLNTVLSIAYFTMLGAAALVLIGALVVKLLAPDSPEWVWGLEVPATLSEHEATVNTTWGTARLEVEDVSANLRMPIGALPWWLFALLWTHAAVAGALILLFLYQLRAIFRRVRDGNPFDADNALRVQRLGWLLGSFVVLNGVAKTVTSAAVARGLASDSITVPIGVSIDIRLIFVAFVLIALGEIFQRGTQLETEQSLVI